MDADSPLSPLLAALAALSAWFRAEKVEGMVIGGVAASIVGRPRVTRDVDVLVAVPEESWDSYLQSGTPFGFVPRIRGAVEFARTSRVLLLRHEPSDTEIDVALAGLPFEREALGRRRVVQIQGVDVPLVTAEDLIVMKAIAHRPRDVTDIEGILDLQRGLDLRRVRKAVQQFAEALDAPDLAADLEKLLKRRPPGTARKRKGNK